MTMQAPVSNWAWTADAYFPATAAPQSTCEEQQFWDLPHKFFSTGWQSYRWSPLHAVVHVDACNRASFIGCSSTAATRLHFSLWWCYIFTPAADTCNSCHACRGRQRPCSITDGISEGYMPSAMSYAVGIPDVFVAAAAANLANTMQQQTVADPN
jgi:hypothetical protein